MTQPNFLYQPETLGNEFSVLTYVTHIGLYFTCTHWRSDFLETLDDGSFFTPPTTVAPSLMSSTSYGSNGVSIAQSTTPASHATASPVIDASPIASTTSTITQTPAITYIDTTTGVEKLSTEAILPSATKTEKFLLTAADQEPGSRDERLNRVIRSKYEAGLLRPYNYVKGYARLSKWMDSQWVVSHHWCYLPHTPGAFHRNRNNRFCNLCRCWGRSFGYVNSVQ